jgi:hypothetical protein
MRTWMWLCVHAVTVGLLVFSLLFTAWMNFPIGKYEYTVGIWRTAAELSWQQHWGHPDRECGVQLLHHRWDFYPSIWRWDRGRLLVPLLPFVLIGVGAHLLASRKGGGCPRCGYDVTGLQVCPECGSPAPV